MLRIDRHRLGPRVYVLGTRVRVNRCVAEADLAAWNIDVRTSDGAGLPPGRGTVAEGKAVYEAKCATCHVPPLFTEPGQNLHTPDEIGVDSFQADRSPTHMYRTAPLAGLWTHQKGGFYHDGRFANLAAVIEHYDSTLRLGLTSDEKAELVEYLKSL